MNKMILAISLGLFIGAMLSVWQDDNVQIKLDEEMPQPIKPHDLAQGFSNIIASSGPITYTTTSVATGTANTAYVCTSQ